MGKIRKQLKINMRRIPFFLIILYVVLRNYFYIRPLNFDYFAFYKNNFIKALEGFFSYSVIQQARPTFTSAFLGGVEYSIGREAYFILAIFFIMSVSVAAGLLIKELTSNSTMFLITFLLSFTLFPITLEPIALPVGYSLSIGLGVFSVVLAVYLVIKSNNTKKNLYRIGAYICILFAMYNYEVGILYLPVLIAIEYIYMDKFSLVDFLKKTWVYFVLGTIYVGVFFGLRAVYSSTYEGVQIHGTLSITQIFETYVQMLSANIPGFFFFYDSSNAYDAPWQYYPDASMKTGSVEYIASSFITPTIIIGAITFFCFILEMFKNVCVRKKSGSIAQMKQECFNTGSINSKLKKIMTILLWIYCIGVPILPACLTEYSVSQVSSKWRLLQASSPYTYIFGVCLLAYMVYKVILTKQFSGKKIIIVVLSTLITVVFGMTLFLNEVNTKTLYNINKKYDYFEEVVLDMDEILPDNSVIYSPTLLSSAAIPGANNYYYDNIFSDSDIKKNALLTNDSKKILEGMEVFYIKHGTSTDYSNTYFTLAKTDKESIVQYENDIINGNKPNLVSNEIYFYHISSEQDYNIVGAIVDSERNVIMAESLGEQINVVTGGESFMLPINTHGEEFGEIKRITLYDTPILVDSLSILPYYKTMTHINEIYNVNFQDSTVGVTLNTANIIGGYHLDRWCEKETEFEVEVGSMGEMSLLLEIDNIARVDDNSKVDIYINGDFLKTVYISDSINEVYIEEEAGEIVNVKLLSNFSFDAEDGRILSYLLTMQNP